MRYEKIIRKNYNIHLITTNRFKTISVDIVFSSQFNKEHVPCFSVLPKMITSSTKKYNSSQLLAIEGENLYGAEVSAFSNVNGNIENFTISLEFLNPKYTEDSMLKKSIEFLYECLFNPNIINNRFEEAIFKINKNNILTNFKSIKDNPNSYASINFKKEMYKNTPLGYHLFNNIKALENITSKDVYDFYLKMIKNFKIDIFVIGNIEKSEEYIKLLDQKFSKISNTFNDKLVYQIDSLKLNSKQIIKKADYSQSHLFIGYCFDNMSDYEKRYVINFYNTILGGISNSILFTEVREKNSLCYSVNSRITKNPYSIIVETEIDKSNYAKAIKLIDSAIKSMGKEGKIVKLFDTAKENINTALNIYYDNKETIQEHYYRKEFITEENIEIKREIYNNIKIDEVINLNKKIKKSVTYFLEGVKDIDEEDSI